MGSNSNMVTLSIVAIKQTVTDCKAEEYSLSCSSERNEILTKLQRLPICSSTLDAFDHVIIAECNMTVVKPDIETTLER
mgnify:FL=1